MPNPKTPKVEPHFEIVRSDDAFHGRRVVGGEVTWTTETMARAVGVERSIISLIRDTLEAASFQTFKVTLEWTDDTKPGDRREKAIYVNGVFFPRRVLYVDERSGEVAA